MTDGPRAEIGILGGSGLYRMEGIEDARDVAVDTPYGPPSAPFRVGVVAGRQVAFLARHGPDHPLLPSDVPYRANVWAMKRMGVRFALSASAVGSLREDLAPRMLVVPDQAIDRTRHREDTFFGDGLAAHVSMADPFAAAARHALVEAARATGHDVTDGGTYLCMEGPQFSTRAESRGYKALGCDVIGMTSYTEARLCREAEIAYAPVCMVTDYDAWRDGEAVSATEILAVLHDNAEAGAEVLRAAIRRLPTEAVPEHESLKTAIVTALDRVPAETLARLAPILAPYHRD